LSVWVPGPASDETPLLTRLDASKSPVQIADSLAQQALQGQTFFVLPLGLSWKEWKLEILRNGDPVIRGAASDAIRATIASAPATLSQVDTTSITIPIGYGLVKPTAWVPWFEPDQILITMALAPSAGFAATKPQITALQSQPGMIVGDGFLNDALSKELRDRIWGASANSSQYKVNNVRSLASAHKVQLTGNLLNVPSPAVVTIQAEFGGDDLKPVSVSGVVDCKGLRAQSCLELRARVALGSAGLTARARTQNQLVRPDEVQNLGNFYVGRKPLNGVCHINRIHSTSGAIVVTALFRLYGGHLR
jgi:hypothetical protein